VQLVLPLKQHELAQVIGVTPEHLSRLFGQLEAESLIVRKAGRLQIPKDSPLLRLTTELPPAAG
jgi:CRP-like cAMP-binding protein